MPSTAEVLRAPRNRRQEEFPVRCLHCTGPLHLITVQVSSSRATRDTVPLRPVQTYVHARHRDWAGAPHAAQPFGW